MKISRSFCRSLGIVCVLVAATTTLVRAEPITFTHTEQNIDWVSAGISGIGGGSGTINVAGVTGPVAKAFLFWHGIDNSGTTAVYDNENITVNGNPVTGTALGDATTNCWGSGSSRAFSADVTSIVNGNGAYLLEGLSNGTGHNANGAALVVTFDDGDGSNNRDLAFFEGNDSNIPAGFPGEDDGWHAALPGINYTGGPAVAQILLSDGQSFPDGTLVFSTVNGSVSVLDSDTLYDGNTLPSAGTSRTTNGDLFDIHNFDIAAAFGGVPGAVQLNIDGLENTSDCLGLVAMMLDLDAFSAPSPGINLDPILAFNLLNTIHDVTATVTDGNGVPLPGVLVDFAVTSGPNAGDNAQQLTNALGEVVFSYLGDDGKGVDRLSASFNDGQDTFSTTALKFWDNDCNSNDVPDTCDTSCAAFNGDCGQYQACGLSADQDNNQIPDECSTPGGGPAACDVIDNDNEITRRDIYVIALARGTVVNPAGGPGDFDSDGMVTRRDFKACLQELGTQLPE